MTIQVGSIWESSTLKGNFRVTGDQVCLQGLDGWHGEIFVGYKAVTADNKSLALVALSQKPDGYPYDWVYTH